MSDEAALYAHRIPTPCACCGAYSLAPDARTTTLLAVCDVLVTKALESLGKSLTRSPRGRYRELDGRPWHVAHTLWPVGDALVAKVLNGAWAVVPPLVDAYAGQLVDSGDVVRMLDRYVHDLAVTGTEHTVDELACRFETRLGLVMRIEHEHAEAVVP